MAAPSRSINYRSGGGIELDETQFKAILASLQNLPKEANKRLRDEARDIADGIIKPAIISAILSHTGAIGPKLAQAVRTRGDRVPTVIIGRARGPYYSGHPGRRGNRQIGPETAKQSMKRTGNQASTNMLRYGSIVGVYRRQTGSADTSGRFLSRGQEVTWPKNIVTPKWTDAASKVYYEPTFISWEFAVNNIVSDFNKSKI